jgi:probable rRNA maturation factor
MTTSLTAWTMLPPSKKENPSLALHFYVEAQTQDLPLIQAWHREQDFLIESLLSWMNAHQLWQAHDLAPLPQEIPWQLEWIFSTNASIQELNQTFRGKNSPTDVLSFPSFENAFEGDDHDETPTTTKIINPLPPHLQDTLTQMGGQLGTVVVSIDYAQAHRGEIPLNTYLIERFIHGTLHVLGYHHATPESYAKVMALQAVFLENFTLSSNP